MPIWFFHYTVFFSQLSKVGFYALSSPKLSLENTEQCFSSSGRRTTVGMWRGSLVVCDFVWEF
jgi:hypothetical protein